MSIFRIFLVLFGFIYFVSSAFSAENSAAKISTTQNSDDKYFHIVQQVRAPTFIQGTDGKWKRSGESVLFNKGDFVQVDKVSPDGTLWLDFSSSKRKERVGIPPETQRAGTSWLGEQDWVKQTDWLNGKFDYKTKEANFKPLVNGSATKLGKYIGVLGREDAQVYLDSDSTSRITLRTDTKSGNSLCNDRQFSEKKCFGPTTEDPMRIKDSTVSYVLNRTTGDYSPKLFYKVETTYCPTGTVKECDGPLKTEEGWVEAHKVSMTRRPAVPNSPGPRRLKTSVFEEKCPDPIKKQVDGLGEGVAATESEFEKEVLSKIGDCVGIEYVTPAQKIRSDLIQKSVAEGGWNAGLSAEQKEEYKSLSKVHFKGEGSPFDKYLRSYWKEQPSQKVANNKLTNEQLFAIDSMARSLYGEMRGCGGETPAFYKAIARSMINRAAIVKSEGPTSPFVKKQDAPVKDKPLNQILPYVVSSDQQISSWNSFDPNMKDNLCPVNKSTNSEQMEAWKSAVKVAWEAVVFRKQFLEETKMITHTHYFSPDALPAGQTEPDWAVGKQKDVSFQIGGNWYGDSSCLVLVRDVNVAVTGEKKKYDKDGKLIKVFEGSNHLIERLRKTKTDAFAWNFIPVTNRNQ